MPIPVFAMQLERRRHIRIPGPFAAAIQVGDQNTTGRIVNLSEGGCSVDGASAPAVGSTVTLEIQLPNAAPLVVSGKADFPRARGYAVLFQRLPKEAYDDLERAVANLRKDAW